MPNDEDRFTTVEISSRQSNGIVFLDLIDNCETIATDCGIF